MTDKKIGNTTSEFQLIDRLKEVVLQNEKTSADKNIESNLKILRGIGDDSAVVTVQNPNTLATTDTMVEGVHFRTSDISWFQLGWKSMVSNQSDIAAMGGTPTFALVTLGVPKNIEIDSFQKIYEGMVAACREFGGRIVGGDIVRSEKLFISVAMMGSPHIDENGEIAVMRRDTAKPGDVIAVTGTLGGSAGGLKVIEQGLYGPDADRLKKMHHSPKARVVEGRELVKRGVITGMDLSDGMFGDLSKICDSSNVTAVVCQDSIPMLKELKNQFPAKANALALAGGEDYELLFTAPFDIVDIIISRLDCKVTQIGQIFIRNKNDQAIVINDRSGIPVDVKYDSWDHLN